MIHEIRMKRLACDPDQETPRKAHADRPGIDLRKIALLEMQQILRAQVRNPFQCTRVDRPETQEMSSRAHLGDFGSMSAQANV